MQSRRSHSTTAPATWPAWVLWALAPLAAVLGVVAGMALAVYTEPVRGPQPVIQASRPAVATPTGTQPLQAPTTITQQPVTSAPSPTGTIIATDQAPRPTRVPDHLPDSAGGRQITPTPGVVQPQPVIVAPRPITNVGEARSVLNAEFSNYAAGTVVVRGIEYQVMRNGGYTTSLVGLLPVGAYEAWKTALEADANRLQAWLDAAAERVRPAVERDRFFLSWAIVEVAPSRPAGFADHEVIAQTDGTYLIIRPLASTTSLTDLKVTLRPHSSLQAVATGQVTHSAGPWVTYGPVIRYDSADIYRPTGVTKPR